MKKTDVLVIGGSAAGLVTAITAKTVNPQKDVTCVRIEQKTLVPCGIPYIFSSVKGTDQNIMPSDKMLADAGVNLVIGKIVSITREEKYCTLDNGDKISYDKLVIATGSTPSIPKWLKGADLENVFTIPKDKVYLDKMQDKLLNLNKIVIIGAGFIGVEISDELTKAGKNVTLVEKLPNILRLAFDKDIAIKAQDLLESRSVKVVCGNGVTELTGDKKVGGILLENGQKIEAEAVILTMGYTANTELAKDAGLKVSDKHFIHVDEYMRTDEPDIFAVGDCAEKTDFVTRKPNPVMLASTACAEARTAGTNLFKLSAVKTFSGTISIFSTAIGDTGFGVAGLTEEKAREEGFDIVTGTFEGIDKHPGTLPGTHKQLVKLIVSKGTNIILGGEVVNGLSAGELTNIIGFIIQNRMDVHSLLTSQIGTHPLLTASPAGYPLVKAAEVIMKNKVNMTK